MFVLFSLTTNLELKPGEKTNFIKILDQSVITEAPNDGFLLNILKTLLRLSRLLLDECILIAVL